MKRIGYISGARILGSVNLGAGGNLIVPGTATITGLFSAQTAILYGAVTVGGVLSVHAPLIATSSLNVGGSSNLNAPVIMNSSLGVAGPTTLNGAVVCVGSLAIGGPLTMHQVVNALQLPAADPTAVGELWVNAGVITRSAG